MLCSLSFVGILLCLQAAAGQADLDTPKQTIADHDIEQHLLIDWLQEFPMEQMRSYIEAGWGSGSSGLVVHDLRIIRAMSEEQRPAIMAAFYGPSYVKHLSFYKGDPRGSVNMNIYFLNDTRPIYDWRMTSKGLRLVNTKMFDLKMFLRAQKSGNPVDNWYIHATDNIQETKDNLRALGLYDAFYRRRVFGSLSDVFDLLNSAGNLQRTAPFYYVVLRNFEGYPNNIVIDEHLDVDMLCSDYFAAKRLLDGDRAVEESELLENGGHRILNTVRIQEENVLFDLRYLGDNYYDISFERKLIDHRVKRWGDGLTGGSHYFFVPEPSMWLYGVLYHALIHKPSMSDTYKRHFSEAKLWGWGWQTGDPSAPGWVEKQEMAKLYNELVRFMNNNGYTLVRPTDKSVYYNIMCQVPN